MITTLILITILLAWLGYETDWLRVRLPIGLAIKPKYATYTVYQMLKPHKVYYGDTGIHHGGNLPNEYNRNGEPDYEIIVNPGVDNVLCGYEWLDEHCADLVDYQPQIQMYVGNVRYNMTIKKPGILKDVMRAVKPSRAEIRAYAQCL